MRRATPSPHHSRLSVFAHAEAGGATVEFVILMPLFIGLLIFMAAASLQFATAGDVQQLAHELARASMPIAGAPDWCTELRGRWVGPVAANLPMLDTARVQQVTCLFDSASSQAHIQVVYDARGTAGFILGSFFGMNTEQFIRDSFVHV